MPKTPNLPGTAREPVVSGHVKSVGWVRIPYTMTDMDRDIELAARDLGVLEVEYMTGLYRYYDTPRRVYEEIRAAQSKGEAVNRLVRNAGFPCAKVAPNER